MRFASSRDRRVVVTLREAVASGMAPDGGLFVPEALPRFTEHEFPAELNLNAVGIRLLAPFFADDPLAARLDEICHEAFTFETPLVPLEGTPGPASALELFHGPTCAFKDIGARFLAATLHRITDPADGRLTILVATSGDTGGAVASAFYRLEPFDVVLFYPKGMVSDRQAHQLSCWGGNVRTFCVRGTFDDCQRMVKTALRDRELLGMRRFSSANSINIGRLLPQMVYYACASLHIFRQMNQKPGFIVPSGNLGNVLACLWARTIGLPIGDIVLATNENSPVPDYLASGVWHPRKAVSTIASAMDVGNPSNMERLQLICPDRESLRAQVEALSVSEDQIRETIRADARTIGRVWCPHSATAAAVYRTICSRDRTQHWVIVATAHPAKFNEIVEPLVGDVPVPSALDALLRLPRIETEVSPSFDVLRESPNQDQRQV